jgi:hypothetical protein
MQLSDAVQQVLKAEGITPQELEEMLSRAAITSLRGANRRFHHWLFRVEDDRVYDMFGHVKEMDSVKRWATHPDCNGQGCKDCLWSGVVPD